MTHDNENADLSDLSTLGFTTRAIHAGQEPDPRTGAVVPAIYQTSTYKQDGVEYKIIKEDDVLAILA